MDGLVDRPALRATWWEEPCSSDSDLGLWRLVAEWGAPGGVAPGPGTGTGTTPAAPASAKLTPYVGAAAPSPVSLCLDPDHPPGCERCTSPPADVHASEYILPGGGEKKLRGLIGRTRQWRDAAKREDLAIQADFESLPELAVALRKRNLAGASAPAARVLALLTPHLPAALRKRHFFFLCRQWGLRSDVWRHVPRRAAALVVATATSSAVLPRERPRGAPCGALPSLGLTSLVEAFATAVDMSALTRAVAAEPHAPLATLDLQARGTAPCAFGSRS